MVRTLKRGYFKFLRLVFYSSDSHHKVAMGAAWGMIYGLTPTVGIQIVGLTLMASCFFALNRASKGRLNWLQFNLPLAIALTWLSNPFNMILLYFIFFLMGCLVLPGYDPIGWEEFQKIVSPILHVDGFESLINTLVEFGRCLVLPMVVGSLIIAIPSAITSYFTVRFLLSRAEERRKLRKLKKSRA